MDQSDNVVYMPLLACPLQQNSDEVNLYSGVLLG